MLLISGASRMSARKGSRVSGPSIVCSPSAGAGLPDAAKAPGSIGIPPLIEMTPAFNKDPAAISKAPGKARFAKATRVTSRRPAIDDARARPPRKGAKTRATAPTKRAGQSLRSSLSRCRQSPPVASPTMKPATSPLTSMGIASQRLTRQALTEFGECLVVDGRQLTDLEGIGAALIEKTPKRAHDPRIELNSLISVELIHRPVMTDRFPVNTIRSHRLVRVGDDDDPRTQRNVLAPAPFRVTTPVVILVMVQDKRR